MGNTQKKEKEGEEENNAEGANKGADGFRQQESDSEERQKTIPKTEKAP